ncbi:MAG TPA: AsmA-like C-terminal region-containing protein [Steroidobacteraceae bacterium]|nr:AsmA-like C-terminal region-containing protein [Steroidobacteraceae bacterium]
MTAAAGAPPVGTPRVSCWLRRLLLALAAAAALLAFTLLVYELARARVPQHRAALERLVRAQTGLDIRFAELGLRWGWYGPEVVFRHVELGEPAGPGEPGAQVILLRAPQLIVGFDAWRTLRSGHPEAGRIQLVAADIDFASLPGSSPARTASDRASGVASSNRGFGRVAVLQRWRGGRIDLEGGTLRLPAPAGATSSVTLQIRRASLRRSADEWSLFGLVFLPDRLGHSARVVLRVDGDLEQPERLGGSLHVEGRRVLFSGWRDLLAGFPALAALVPRGGGGDLTVELDFAGGRILKAGGQVHASGLSFPALHAAAATADAAASLPLSVDALRGEWRLARHGVDWRLRIDSLEWGDGRLSELSLDVADSGQWLRGSVQRAPLEPVVALVQWLDPGFDLAGVRLAGSARGLRFDWDGARPAASRLRAQAEIEDLAFVPRSRDFVLSGLGARVTGTESAVSVELHSRAARLELTRSGSPALPDLRVSSALQIGRTPAGWRVSTGEFLLQHSQARLVLSGALWGAAGEPAEIDAHGVLVGADIPLVKELLGSATAQFFGAAASQLVAGEIRDAQFTMRGPLGELPFGGRGTGLSGSLQLREAVLSGGDLWPDMAGVTAQVQWQGAKIQASLDAGRAGPFQISAARAEWDAAGAGATRLTGRIGGRLEDALVWVRDHPGLQVYAPGVRDLAARGFARFDLDVAVPGLVPEGVPASEQQHPRAASRTPVTRARVAISFEDASLQALDGLPPLRNLSGALVFDDGHLQRSTLEGGWLGGPLMLRIAEHRQRGRNAIRVQAQGVATAAELMDAADAGAGLQGQTDWNGTFDYLAPAHGQPARWRLRADSNLLGLASSLPEPLAKRAAVAIPARIDLSGGDSAALARLCLGDRVRSVLAMRRQDERGWQVDRGAVNLGTAVPALPAESMVLVDGRIGRLDLAAYAVALRRLREDVPPVRARIAAAELVAGGRTYESASLQAERTPQGTDVLIEADGLTGTAHWPALSLAGDIPAGVAREAAIRAGLRSAEIHLARLDLPDSLTPGEGPGPWAALAPLAHVSVDELNWRGRALGRMTAEVAVQDGSVALDDVHVLSATQNARGSLRCRTEPATCRLTFGADSNDAAGTLADFGFRRELSAGQGTLSGTLEWPWGATSWLAAVRGNLSLRLTNGGIAESSAGMTGLRFPLLAIPALVGGLEPGAADSSAAAGSSTAADASTAANASAAADRGLRFTRLAADFDLEEGEASTSNLHLDGDAEILMRGRIGLVARDYDQQVWVLRGEDRLPAAIRRFGATPGVAAAWLGLREFLTGGAGPPRTRAVLRLQGSWDDPIVAAAN